MKEIHKPLFLLFGFITIICLIILISPFNRMQKGKVFFSTGRRFFEDTSSEPSYKPADLVEHKKAVEKINRNLQSTLDQYYKEHSSAAPFSIDIKYLDKNHACVEYDSRGKGITSMIDFLLRDAAENRFLISANKEVKYERKELAYSGGYSRGLDRPWIAHLSGYIGIFAVIVMMYCWKKAPKTKEDLGGSSFI